MEACELQRQMEMLLWGGGVLLVLRMKSPNVGGWVHPASCLHPKTACGNGSQFISAAEM